MEWSSSIAGAGQVSLQTKILATLVVEDHVQYTYAILQIKGAIQARFCMKPS